MVVEDGTGLSNADAYVSVADADIYHASYNGSTDWSGATTAAKEMAIMVATQYIDNTYGSAWKGTRTGSVQSLDWPRAGVQDQNGFVQASDELPNKLKQAAAEVALRHVQGDDIMVDIDEPGTISEETLKAGPVSTTVKYAGGMGQVVQFSIVDALLQHFIGRAGKLVRS